MKIVVKRDFQNYSESLNDLKKYSFVNFSVNLNNLEMQTFQSKGKMNSIGNENKANEDRKDISQRKQQAASRGSFA